MYKKLLILILGLAFAVEMLSAAHNKIEIKAKYIESTENIVTAKENVVVYYDDAIIRASSAIFNKTTKLLVLDGNIEQIGYRGGKEHTNHMEIQTDTKEVTFDELFLVSENDVWILSDDVRKANGVYNLGTSFLSSCDIDDPLWKMVFSSSTYDTNEKYMKLYNTKVYLGDIPVFYSPYLAFSTDKERSSGLLFPGLGYTETEGFLYEQPIFWAISPSVDMEFNPQIRTSRSVGLYSTLRFVDSNHSSGKIRLGYFKDQESYTQEYNLPNESHYGIEFNYDSSKVFQDSLPAGFTDGLYVNATYLNDIDYLYLQRKHLTHFGFTPLQESRINYFAHDNDLYFGLNAKYFIDTRKIDNDDTLQILPSMQFHKYLSHVFTENFTYSVDMHVNNYDRKEGATMRQAEIKIPLDFTTSFFDDFLNVSLGEELYASAFYFGNGNFIHDDLTYYSNIHKVKLFTDLTKKYDGFIHVLQPSVEYIKPGSENQSIDSDLFDPEQKALFTVGLPEEKYEFSLNQYFYDDKMKLKFYQRLSQKYYVDREYKLADLSNEMSYVWDKLTLYNNITYAHEFSKVREMSSYVSFKESDYYLSVGHIYKEVLPDVPTDRAANDMNFLFGYTYNEQIKLNGGVTYNIDDSSNTQWMFGGSYYRDCWSMNGSIRQDIRPTSAGPVTLSTFYLQLNFTPFGSVGTGNLGQPLLR